jgi:O-antigen/teichoic acid export membrane protein
VITLQRGVNTAYAVGTSELIQSTRNARAALLVLAASAVEVAVALLLGRHTGIGGLSVWTQSGRVARQTTVNVIGLAFAESCMKMETGFSV